MKIRELTTTEDQKRYRAWLEAHPNGNLWQSLERKQYVEALGQKTRLYVAEDEQGKINASALIVIDRTTGGFSTWDIPRGPIWSQGKDETAKDLVKQIATDAKNDKALALYFSPLEALPFPGSRDSGRHIHAEATRLIDLRQSEEETLAQMKQKGRYNIRVAEKHGVDVQESNDIAAFYRLVQETSARDRFRALSQQKYQAFLNQLPGSFLLLAYPPSPSPNPSPNPNPNPIAGLLGLTWNGLGIYYYGASNHAQRALMAPYALQWAAMQRCKRAGCGSYDLLGVAPPDQPNHPWAGITSFKEQFGGQFVTYPREQMIVVHPWIKKLFDIKRSLLG